MSEPDLVARLAQLDSCTVSDALDQLGHGGAVSGLRAFGAERRIAGRAITVRLERATVELAAARAARGTAPRHLGTAAVDASGPGDIIVVSNGGGPGVSGWGGILSLGAKRNGVEGVIVDGGCRDVDEARDLDLPLYARNAVPQTARGRVTETAWNEPVLIADILVTPGDLVIADGSGAVFLPAAHAALVIDAAEKIAARERAMMEAIRAGAKLVEVMGATYEGLTRPVEG